ncbi:hypothetical protein H310_02128 [Aphanomyces invadans]|uniref:Uncharacterized protein n=1 Tax=Aphanomyces invadans TaxID=157072 RepID=A0A024UNA3_9STRA|nr:hypothetical protein H310_02128 [Aphanomyces invadans]ETW07665.1 hypothetical protein H310_02128 [Aphanomyces invadans]|eukprot:XP_008863758.1 hypothetical protein H310_02128 [Aphanomyces invadans]
MRRVFRQKSVQAVRDDHFNVLEAAVVMAPGFRGGHFEHIHGCVRSMGQHDRCRQLKRRDEPTSNHRFDKQVAQMRQDRLGQVRVLVLRVASIANVIDLPRVVKLDRKRMELR